MVVISRNDGDGRNTTNRKFIMEPKDNQISKTGPAVFKRNFMPLRLVKSNGEKENVMKRFIHPVIEIEGRKLLAKWLTVDP